MSTRYLCLRCWRTPSAAELQRTCPRCARMSRSAAHWLEPLAHVDARSAAPRWLSDPARRNSDRCATHTDTRYDLACPCGAALGDDHGHQPDDLTALGVVGPRAWGKTLLALTALTEWRRTPNGSRPALLGLGDTETRFAALAQALYSGVRPDTTAPAATVLPREARLEHDAQNFCWRVQAGDGRAAFLTLHDAAGETWGLASHEHRELFDRYCTLLTSIVFLVDGRGLAADLELPVEDAWRTNGTSTASAFERQWMATLLARLGPRAARVDVALVVSQADHVWSRAGFEHLRPAPNAAEPVHDEAVRTLLRTAGRADLLSFADRFRSLRAFAASSLGFVPVPSDIDTTGRLRRRPQPVGVVEPFAWLLQQGG